MDAFLLAAKFLLPLYSVRLFQEIASYLLCVYEEPLQNIEINIGFIQPSIGWVSLAGYKPGFDDRACLRFFFFSFIISLLYFDYDTNKYCHHF